MAAAFAEDRLEAQVESVGPRPVKRLSAPRLAREWKTIRAMIRLYCRRKHGTSAVLCAECQELFNYAGLRLERCRFGSEKPTCAKCPVHCYLPERREQIRLVMRFAGPRMVWKHPILSLQHCVDSLSRRPEARTE